VVVGLAAEAVLLVKENEVMPVAPPDVPGTLPRDVGPTVGLIVIAAPALPVVEGGMDMAKELGHCPGKEIVEEVGAGKLASIAVG
jgi:hypothetical protein